MARRTKFAASIAARVLILTLALAVFALGTESVSHSHGFYHDEDHCTCQVCHAGHAAIPKATAHVQIESALPVARFVATEKPSLGSETLVLPSNPRAPPA